MKVISNLKQSFNADVEANGRYSTIFDWIIMWTVVLGLAGFGAWMLFMFFSDPLGNISEFFAGYERAWRHSQGAMLILHGVIAIPVLLLAGFGVLLLIGYAPWLLVLIAIAGGASISTPAAILLGACVIAYAVASNSKGGK
jgi:hypothetical protein